MAELSIIDCLPCAARDHWDCYYLEGNNCCCESLDGVIDFTKEAHEHGYKEDADVTDPKSTGRKRAALLYPLKPGQACTWQELKFAGGGVYPIMGCVSGLAVNRHHGPDKDTLNNAIGNVHLICAKCHNRWHTLNDPLYSKSFGTEDWKAHDATTKATPEELFLNETRWQSKPTERITDE